MGRYSSWSEYKEHLRQDEIVRNKKQKAAERKKFVRDVEKIVNRLLDKR
jgi:hypothetical protein